MPLTFTVLQYHVNHRLRRFFNQCCGKVSSRNVVFPNVPFVRITKTQQWLATTSTISELHEETFSTANVHNLCQSRCLWCYQIQQSHGDTPLIFLKNRVKCTWKKNRDRFEKVSTARADSTNSLHWVEDSQPPQRNKKARCSEKRQWNLTENSWKLPNWVRWAGEPI